jgi:hydroxypyruvate isomerase
MIEKVNSRRNFVRQSSLGLGALMLSPTLMQCTPKLKGNIKQVVAAWPFMATGPKWSPEEFLQYVSSLGLLDVELFPVEHWALLKKYNMVCAATKSHTFIRGMNNRNHQSECFAALEKAIEDSSVAGFPNVMTFTGLEDTSQEKNGSKVSAEEGMKNCIEGYKKMVRIAEKKNVTLILEPLNSRVTELMKGHPGYQGDHIDYCMDIIKAVSSPALKLLFDVYHIQIMDGNLIANINKYIEYIAHVQVAGNPGRGEIGDGQEINYRAIMKTLLKNGYKGYVGHEWIPTGDAMTGLREAIQICDI